MWGHSGAVQRRENSPKAQKTWPPPPPGHCGPWTRAAESPRCPSTRVHSPPLPWTWTHTSGGEAREFPWLTRFPRAGPHTAEVADQGPTAWGWAPTGKETEPAQGGRRGGSERAANGAKTDLGTQRWSRGPRVRTGKGTRAEGVYLTAPAQPVQGSEEVRGVGRGETEPAERRPPEPAAYSGDCGHHRG